MFNVSEFSFKSFEGTHWEHRGHTGYIHFVPYWSQCCWCVPSCSSLFPVYPTFPMFPVHFPLFPQYICVECVPDCVRLFPVWSPLFPVFPIESRVATVFPLVPCFSYFSPSVSRLFLVFWLCNLWEATLTSSLVGGMWTDTIGNTLGNILRTIRKNGEHTGYTLGTRPTVWIIERAHWEHKKHRGVRVEGLSSCFLRIRSSFNVQCLWVFL